MKACFLRAVDCLALRSGASSMNSHEQRHRCSVMFWLARVLKMRATVQRPLVLASEMLRGELTLCRCVACKRNQHVPSTQSKFLGHVLIGNAHLKCHGTQVSLRSSGVFSFGSANQTFCYFEKGSISRLGLCKVQTLTQHIRQASWPSFDLAWHGVPLVPQHQQWSLSLIHSVSAPLIVHISKHPFQKFQFDSARITPPGERNHQWNTISLFAFCIQACSQDPSQPSAHRLPKLRLSASKASVLFLKGCSKSNSSQVWRESEPTLSLLLVWTCDRTARTSLGCRLVLHQELQDYLLLILVAWLWPKRSAGAAGKPASPVTPINVLWKWVAAAFL